MLLLLRAMLPLACACAHAATAPVTESGFLQLESAHYLLLTDLPAQDARLALQQMENARGALVLASWQGQTLRREKLRVLELTWSALLHQFASPSMSAFYQPVDLFG